QGVGVPERGSPRPVVKFDPVAVYLVHPHHPPGQPDRRGEPPAVCCHRRRLLTDGVAEVECVKGRFGDATCPGGRHSPDTNAHVTSIREPFVGNVARPSGHSRGLATHRRLPQRRMKGGTSTSSSSPPIFRVDPLVGSGTLTAATGSNSA